MGAFTRLRPAEQPSNLRWSRAAQPIRDGLCYKVFGERTAMTKTLIAWLMLGAALWPGAAGANWQYTKWGMTPQQVQSAAKGKLSPITAADSCLACASVPLLAGNYAVGGQVFRVRFEFDDGKTLSKVVLAMPAKQQTWGCNELFDSLSLKYGAPAWTAPLTGDGSLPNARWLDPHDENTVFFNDISLQTSMCVIQYSPMVTGKGL